MDFMGEFPYLYQINCSPGGVPKLPVAEAWVSVEGIEGDGHRNRQRHGGPDRALCLYSFEILEVLQQEGHRIYAGASGKNLTVAGLNWTQLEPGARLKIGENLHIELTGYCEPCRQNARWFLEENFQRISHRHHPGWSRMYARVVSEGRIRSGDQVWIEALSGGELI
jgi:MOSC domain-containing protein YiiM